MYARVVEGLTLPVLVGGHEALDFCNTLAGWGDSAPKEYLKSYAHLAVWAGEAGVIEPGAGARLRSESRGHPSAAAGALERALSFRAALYAVCLEPRAGRCWDLFASEAQAAARSHVFVPEEGRGRWVVTEASGWDRPLFAVAHRASELIASDGLSAVRRCPGRGCGWLFLDPSGRRRWCSMAVCGNRAKARRHARKVREGVAAGR